MRFKLAFFFALFLFSCTTQKSALKTNGAELRAANKSINHISSIGDVIPLLESLNENDLVVWDIDYVILVAKHSSFRPRADKLLGPLYRKYTASHGAQKVIEAKARLMLHLEEELVDPVITDIISDLQNRKVPTIALTAWGVEPYGSIEDPLLFRSKALREHGISFTWPKKVHPKIWDDNVGFRGNIIGSGKIPKGQMLMRFLDYAQFKPKRLVFVDDREVHVKGMQEACHKAGIDFYGFHYQADVFAKDPAPNECVIQMQFEAALENKAIPSEQSILMDIDKRAIKCDDPNQLQP